MQPLFADDFTVLLNAVAENPSFDAPREAYAAALDREGSDAAKARAGFIRLQVAAAQALAAKDIPKWKQLEDEAGLLKERWEEGWLPEGFRESVGRLNYHWVRGFVESVTVGRYTIQDPEVRRRIDGLGWVRKLTVTPQSESDQPAAGFFGRVARTALGPSPALGAALSDLKVAQGVEALSLVGSGLDVLRFRRVFDHARRLIQLNLDLSSTEVSSLLRSPVARRLVSLDVIGKLGQSGLDQLVHTSALPKLRRLKFHSVNVVFGAISLAGVGSDSSMPALESFEVVNHASGLEFFVASSLFRRLRYVAIKTPSRNEKQILLGGVIRNGREMERVDFLMFDMPGFSDAEKLLDGNKKRHACPDAAGVTPLASSI